MPYNLLGGVTPSPYSLHLSKVLTVAEGLVRGC